MRAAALYTGCAAAGTVLGIGIIIWWMEHSHRFRRKKRYPW